MKLVILFLLSSFSLQALAGAVASSCHTDVYKYIARNYTLSEKSSGSIAHSTKESDIAKEEAKKIKALKKALPLATSEGRDLIYAVPFREDCSEKGIEKWYNETKEKIDQYVQKAIKEEKIPYKRGFQNSYSSPSVKNALIRFVGGCKSTGETQVLEVEDLADGITLDTLKNATDYNQIAKNKVRCQAEIEVLAVNDKSIDQASLPLLYEHCDSDTLALSSSEKIKDSKGNDLIISQIKDPASNTVHNIVDDDGVATLSLLYQSIKNKKMTTSGKIEELHEFSTLIKDSLQLFKNYTNSLDESNPDRQLFMKEIEEVSPHLEKISKTGSINESDLNSLGDSLQKMQWGHYYRMSSGELTDKNGGSSGTYLQTKDLGTLLKDMSKDKKYGASFSTSSDRYKDCSLKVASNDFEYFQTKGSKSNTESSSTKVTQE